MGRHYTQSNTYIARQSQHKSPSGVRQEGTRGDGYYEEMTYRLVPPKNHSTKTDRWFRAKNRRNCKRLPIALKGNRSFTTSCLKTPLVLFDLFSQFACIGFAFLSDFYNAFSIRLSHVKCRFYMINDCQKVSDQIYNMCD